MTGEDFMADAQTGKGAKTRLFGVGLIFLGVLDSMLSWRGGFEVSHFYIALMAAGAVLYFIGSVKRGRKTRQSQ